MPGNPDRARDLNRLAGIWKGLGLHVLEMPGWEHRGRSATIAFDVLGCHHTGSPTDGDRILRDGRPGIPGPLCNVALHANGDVVLVASGRANHFGSATWPNARSLGVEATGPPFHNHDAYVALAAGFCTFKGADPKHVVRDDVAIPVHLVAAHKEVAVDPDHPRRYGRKPDPAFDEPGRTIEGLRLIDTFRDQVHARMAQEDDMTTDELLHALESKRGQEALKNAVTDVLRAGFGGHAPGLEDNPRIGPSQRWLFSTIEKIRRKLDA
jgi:hypothetical protein